MSRVTDVILIVDGGEVASSSFVEQNDDSGDLIAQINIWLIKQGHAPLKILTDSAGGTKVMRSVIFAGGFSYFDADRFLKEVSNVKWEFPQSVQVLIKAPDDAGFSIRVIKEG